MLRAVVTFIVVAVLLLVLISALGGWAGPFELVIVLVLASAAAFGARRWNHSSG
jgi:hypothetical protein